MKRLRHRLVALSAIALGALSISVPTAATTFGQQEVDQSRFIAVSSSGVTTRRLLILEQVSDARPCWSESGANPTIVTPLLLQFDFTGICNRATDRNGYSIRVNGQDMGLDYSIRILPQNGDLVMLGVPNDRSRPQLVIGRANGMTQDFAKIILQPGWRFTKRTFGDRTLGHVYLTYEGVFPPGDVATQPTPTPLPTPTPAPTPTPTPAPVTFTDISRDIYATQIRNAVAAGFISGFPDNTFRPLDTLTREQLVSMVLDALTKAPNVNLRIPAAASGDPYRDVNASRWSAAKIQFARDNNIVRGYEDGTFRPAQPVTRAELVSVLKRAAEFALTARGSSPTLLLNQPTRTFADTTNHWASATITELSGFCGVASPLNEQGNNFAPNAASQRNYAAAATLRMIDCLQLPQ